MNLTVTPCNPSTLEAETEGLGVQGWLGLHETLKKQWKGFALIIKMGPNRPLPITSLYLGSWGKNTAHLKPAGLQRSTVSRKKNVFNTKDLLSNLFLPLAAYLIMFNSTDNMTKLLIFKSSWLLYNKKNARIPNMSSQGWPYTHKRHEDSS